MRVFLASLLIVLVGGKSFASGLTLSVRQAVENEKVYVTNVPQRNPPPRLRVGSRRGQPCTWAGSAGWLCEVPSGSALGPQYVTFADQVTKNDSILTIISRKMRLIIGDKSTLPDNFGALPARQADKRSFSTILNSRQLTYMSTNKRPENLSDLEWKKTIEYFNRKSIYIPDFANEDQKSVEALIATFLKPNDLKQLRGIQNTTTLTLPTLPKSFLQLNGNVTIGESRPILDLLDSNIDGFLKVLPLDKYPSQLKEQLKEDLARLSGQRIAYSVQGGLPIGPGTEACRPSDHTESLENLTSPGAAIQALQDANYNVSFDPNTDPWSSSGISETTYPNESRFATLPEISAPNLFNVYVIDTYQPVEKIDSYRTPNNNGHGVIIGKVISERSGFPATNIEFKSPCVSDGCKRVNMLRLIGELCNTAVDIKKSMKKSIVNLSISTPIPSSMLLNAIKMLLNEGAYVLTSHGNTTPCKSHRFGDICNSYPADYTSVADLTQLSGKLWSVSAKGEAEERAQPIARYSYLNNGNTSGIFVPTSPTLLAPWWISSNYPDTAQLQPYQGTSFSTAIATRGLAWYLAKCGKFPQTSSLIQDIIDAKLPNSC